MPTFTTGPSVLPDVGVLSYNGCIFSPLFETKISGNVVKDDAGRTVKYTELTIDVDGYVTLSDRVTSISPSIVTMHRLLTAQGGVLIYRGRGWDLSINTARDGVNDLAWGPIPELMEFQPLGGGLSAKVKWRVKVHITGQSRGPVRLRGIDIPLLQFNHETSVTYGEDGFSSLSIRGTLEIPLTRTPTQDTRTITYTADTVRSAIQDAVMSGIDMSRFRITRREFPLSRDKRTITWTVEAEEKPYMDLPPNCTIARGTFSVKPATAGPGLAVWLCSLNATYTLRKDAPRRQAYLLFLALMRLRMAQSQRDDIANLEQLANQQQQQNDLNINPNGNNEVVVGIGFGDLIAGALFGGVLPQVPGAIANIVSPAPANSEQIRRAILMDFNISEGLYLDSKTVTFSATWRITVRFQHILIASGLWAKLRETNADGSNLWATTMRDVNGAFSWLGNRYDPAFAVIVDFGS